MYVVHRDIVLKNVCDIHDAFDEVDVECILSYSCKTNNAKNIVRLMIDIGVVPEVVSESELELCADPNFAIINGVAWSNHDVLADCIDKGYLVNFNSLEQMKSVLGLVKKKHPIGIRVGFEGSRFGIEPDDLMDAVKYAESQGFEVECLHCHMSGCRPKHRYQLKVDNVICLLLETGFQPGIVDFGGNMYGELPDEMAGSFNDVCGFRDYARIIADGLARLDYKPTVAIELGTALIANAVDISAEVVDADEYGRVVLDITKYAFGNMKPIMLVPRGRDNVRQIVYGCSCMEDDVITGGVFSKLMKGDKVMFKNCGAYTYSLCPDFIVKKGEVMIL